MENRLLLGFVVALVVVNCYALPSKLDDDETRDLLGLEDKSREELEEDAEPEVKAQPPPDESGESISREIIGEEDDEEDVFQSFPNIFKILKMPSMRPWWDGPNVCVEREMKESSKENETESSIGTGNFFVFGTAQFSSCKHSPNKYQCTTITSENGKTKTSTVTYQCCHGFRRTPKSSGCKKVETKPLLVMAEESGYSQFAAMLRSSGIALNSGNVTIFVPSDDSVIKFQDSVGYQNNIDGQGSIKNSLMTNEVMEENKPDTDINQVIRNHIVTGLIETDDFSNDKILYNENNNSTIRINIFPSREMASMTANCVRINMTNMISTDGIMHTIDSVLMPVTKSVEEIISQPKYSDFKKLLEEHDLYDKLKGKGPMTVLALTNEQLAKLDLTDLCIGRILKHHLLPHTVCSEAATPGKISALDLVSDWLRMEKDEEGTLVFEGGVKALVVDQVAMNGVVHEVERLIIPQAAKAPSELLKNTNHTKFLALLERAKLVSAFDTIQDITIFVPSESGLTKFEDELMEMNDEELKHLLQYHVATKKLASQRLRNHDQLETLNKNETLHVSLVNNILAGLAGLGTRALVQCSPLTKIDGEMCNGIVHEISIPVFPATKTIYEIVRDSDELESLRKVLEGTKLEEELKSGSLADVTILAPTNEAFEKMGSGNMDILLKDKDLADQILRNHILKGVVCCSGIGTSSWPFLPSEESISGSQIETNRSYRSNKVTFAGVASSKCDMSATNGLVHFLSGVILPAGHRRNTDIVYRRPNSDIILTGF